MAASRAICKLLIVSYLQLLTALMFKVQINW